MRRPQRSFHLLGLVLLVLLLPSAAGAWEWAYGPLGARDDAFRRVTPVPACGAYPAGYIAIGTQNPGGANSDVYVVRTNLAGNWLWERTYDVQGLGVVDDGIAIAAVAGGGYVFLSNTANGLWSPALTRINCDGTVAWSQVYRDVVAPGGNLFGNDLIVAQTGNPAAGTNAGDLVVAGFWRGSNEDAFLMRTTAAGAGPIWSQVYHVAPQEAFNGVAEAAPVGAAPTGDLVAVGRINAGDPQGLVARVNGDNGTIGAAPQCMAQHGLAGTNETYESVTRLQVAFPNQFAMVGTSSSPGAWLSDVWITRGNPCALAAQSRVGSPAGAAPTNEQGFDIRQVLVANAGGPPVGSLAIAGSHAIAALGGPNEASLLFVTPGPLMPLGGMSRLFGDFGTGQEVFFSLAQNPGGGAHPPGYILAGLTQTDWDGFGDPQDMYLVHYDPAAIGCAQVWNPAGVALGWPQTALAPAWRTLVRTFPVPAPTIVQFNPFQICP